MNTQSQPVVALWPVREAGHLMPFHSTFLNSMNLYCPGSLVSCPKGYRHPRLSPGTQLIVGAQ